MKTVVGKIVILGSAGVGKTSTVQRYIDSSFDQHTSPTVGASFFTYNLPIDDMLVTLQIWDTAGQERFKAMAPLFYRNANAAILVYDITSYGSFELMKEWVHELRRNIEDPVMVFVVGNKLDLSKDRKVSRDEAIQYANSIGATHFESSAKTSQGVGDIFTNIARGFIRLLDQGNNAIKVYDDAEGVAAKATDLEATDTGVEETVHLSIDSIAHGKSVSNCC